MKFNELSQLLCELSPTVKAKLAGDLLNSLFSQQTDKEEVPSSAAIDQALTLLGPTVTSAGADEEVEFHNPFSLTFLEQQKVNQFIYSTIMSLDPDQRKDLPLFWHMTVGVSPEMLKQMGPEIELMDLNTAKELMDLELDRARRLLDACTNIQGFLVFNSIGGGKGSGLGSLALERASINISKHKNS